MSRPIHTYGPTCRLSAVIGNVSSGDNDIPPLKAHFFYSSPLPIDDPLSAIPIPTGAESKSTKHPPRPFSARDNNALEEAWLGLSTGKHRKDKRNHKKGKHVIPSKEDVTSDQGSASYESARKSSYSEDLEVGQGQGDAADERCASEVPAIPEPEDLVKESTASRGRSNESSKDFEEELRGSEGLSSSFPILSDGTGTTGLPFLKFSSTKLDMGSSSMEEPIEGISISRPENFQRNSDLPSNEAETLQAPRCKSHEYKEQAHVPVGVSRLHLVKLPALQMQPIYWSPIHDIAAVIRGTWFYKETMCPVDSAVSNQLETGYRELRPWSQTWKDEINSAIEVGAAGEEKIAHRLWPNEVAKKSKSHRSKEHPPTSDPYCAVRCFDGEASAEGITDPDDPRDKLSDSKTIMKRYPNSQVIYKDAQNAFILKPTLQPSAYYGRRPLNKIKKGMVVGIHCVRGFDWKLWAKLHPSKKSGTAVTAEENAPVAGDAGSKSSSCPACRAHDEPQKVTDLILVIHGIGQKLSERVESFHFTHAINAFRRSVNVESSNEAVHRTFRADLGGVMVLPVNWRSNLSFEDGGPMKKSDQDRNSSFSLRDITPSTIPAVRNMISDVMLDIPFYMSHHKPKMIRALISEANRVYRLWCKNNPEFHENGRVHIIAHSLGSVMALEVLSKQPTLVPKVDLHAKKINTKYFDFSTTNLFFVGSPAGFFLLLDKGQLIPRRAQGKPGADLGDEKDKKLTGEEGTLGCLAVDNIYNIMHYNDPIAYRLNATIDLQFAASLRNAQVPSATTGFFAGIGNVLRSITPGVAAPSDLAIGQVAKPPALPRLPSQLEMEVHDFTREEIAEKKFFLLNDCGQVDWFLSSGGGPLEIQYLNMLGAHSSYWASPDFIRLVVVEVSRTPGREYALPNMKAVKFGHKQRV
ncbi:DDHD domain protein [Diplocarpon rosae]|nr:DDHD domain protein [Diplocarpon rosae]